MVAGDNPIAQASNLAMSESIHLLGEGYSVEEVDAAISRAWRLISRRTENLNPDIRPSAFYSMLSRELTFCENYIEGKRNSRPHLYTQLTPEALAERVGGEIVDY